MYRLLPDLTLLPADWNFGSQGVQETIRASPVRRLAVDPSGTCDAVYFTDGAAGIWVGRAAPLDPPVHAVSELAAVRLTQAGVVTLSLIHI